MSRKHKTDTMNAVEQLLLGGSIQDFITMDLLPHDTCGRTTTELLSHRTLESPPDCGIMIELRSCEDLFDGNSREGLVILHTAVPDASYENIHPNCHAPADLRNVHLLYGGGSGTAVFFGSSDSLGNIVMKHGGAKDAQEVFSLISIRQQLSIRTMFQQQLLQQEARAAARRMQRKIPEFVMAYISPFHTRNRSQELWASLRFGLSRSTSRNTSSTNLNLLNLESDKKNTEMFRSARSLFRSSLANVSPAHSVGFAGRRNSAFSTRMSIAEKNKIVKEERKKKRNLRVRIGEDAESRWNVNDNVVEVMIHSNLVAENNENKNHYVVKDGIDGLLKFASGIRQEIANHHWKITLAQKAIGGLNAENGAHALLSGKLVVKDSFCDKNDFLLHKLVIDFCQVMEDLSTLTYPQERSGKRLQNILETVEILKASSKQVDGDGSITYNYDNNFHLVSKELDLFVGSSIVKNFNPFDGRFLKLREFAADLIDDQILFCESSDSCSMALSSEEELIIRSTCDHFSSGSLTNYVLSEAEKIPARFLAILLFSSEFDGELSEALGIENKVGIDHVFVDAPAERCVLDEMKQRGWFSLLEHATCFAYDENLGVEAKAAALDCIWTCGLTDAGLHNTFISQERGLELFDLGEPQLEPQPAFLTKFLMSYFHTAGMEDDENCHDTWIRRFTVVYRNGEQLLELADATKLMIPNIHKSFSYTMDYFIEHIFCGNEQVRSLLVKYVILQLLSDSSFCIARWEEKGGGSERYGQKLKQPLEKWLWRSLWDQYIACYVYTNVLLPCENL